MRQAIPYRKLMHPTFASTGAVTTLSDFALSLATGCRSGRDTPMHIFRQSDGVKMSDAQRLARKGGEGPNISTLRATLSKNSRGSW
jgi:hypothetical protein